MSYKPKVENWDAQTKNVPEIDIPIKGAVNIKTRPSYQQLRCATGIWGFNPDYCYDP